MPKSKAKKSAPKAAVRGQLSALKKQIKTLETVKKHLEAGSAQRRKQSVVWVRALGLLRASA